MRKIFILTIIAMFTIIGKNHAQSQMVATLEHEGTISTFTGTNAFVDAHAAATHGDIITLSSGMFAAPLTLTKAVTVYGTGIVSDSVSAQTIINSDMMINIPDSVSQRLTLEGLYFKDNSDLYYHNVNQAVFNKCRIYCYDDNTTSSVSKDVVFNQCKITSNYTNSTKSSATFNNCFINFQPVNSTSTGPVYINNSVISFDKSTYINQLRNSVLTNCYLFSSISSVSNYVSLQLPSTTTAVNCIGSESITYTFSLFANVIDNSTDQMVDSLGAVFKTWRGTYSDQETFELTDEAKAKYLGNDGTQIGIYGGAMPYDPTPSNPRITKFYLTPKPSENKLEIQLEAK